MADLKPLLGFGFSIFFWILISTTVAADPSFMELEALHSPSELEQLKSKISFLGSLVEEGETLLVRFQNSVYGGWRSRWLADRVSHLQSLWN